MLSFPVFVATYSRRASTPPHLCGPGALCVEIPLPRSPLTCCDHTVLILWEDPGLYGTPSGSLSTIALSPLPATSMDLPASVANKRLMAKLNLLDATLTENTGGGLRPLQRATRRSYLAAALKPFPFILLRTLWHRAKVNPFIFKRFQTLCPKHPGWGYLKLFNRSSIAVVGRDVRIRPIAAQSLWCNNLQRHGISSPSGETTPLPPVSKITRADIGNRSMAFPVYPDPVGVASRAWVQRSNTGFRVCTYKP